MNCHFDSVPMGPGASDDAVSCGVMLEISRVMLTSPRTSLSNDLIFTPSLGQCEGRGRGGGGGAGAGGQSSGHHTSGVHRYCPELRTFIDKHPAWVSLGAWTVDYKYYIL